MVTVVCTSFNRPDLLETTLRSFFKFNTYKISGFTVQDDSGKVGCNDHLKAEFSLVDFRYNKIREGQIRSIDTAYKTVMTPYIFHMEEDWEFYQGGFIEASLKVLEAHKKVVCVWIRSESDTNNHKHDGVTIEADGVEFSLLQLNHNKEWHGFTFNPSLRRLSDWQSHRGYSSLAVFNPKRPWHSEMRIGHYYKQRGYRAAIIRGEGYVKHIGENRGIRQ